MIDLESFAYFIDVLKMVLQGIFRHEAFKGTGITFLDVGIFFLIISILVSALIVSVRVTTRSDKSNIFKSRKGK